MTNKPSVIITSIAIISFSFLTNCSQNKTAEASYSGDEFSALIRSTEARTPEQERQGFKLPEGFEIQLYASEPNIGKPINFAFDAGGRMWVTQSSEYPFAATPGEGKDLLTIVEDTNGDGKADKFTSFIDTLNIPIGVLPLNKEAIVYSIPYLYKFTDSNEDGKAESVRKLFGPFKTRDTHGMINNLVRGFDGWVHACHGYTNRDTIAGTDGQSISMISGNTFRFDREAIHTDHTTNGRINPFGLVYDEWGYQYSTDCHSSPLYQLIRNADYMQWGKEEEMGFGPEMTPLTNEATALAGIGYYGDVHFPEDYRSNFFVGDVVRSRIYRYSNHFNGSTPVGKREEDFVLSQDPWFRPVDVKMGPDGALYIADFYNAVIGHYEVPLDHPKRDHIKGRIWRITYNGKHNAVNNWTQASINGLIDALNAENISVRMTAADQITDRLGNRSVQAVQNGLTKKNISSRQYIHLLWVLQRMHSLNKEIVSKSISHSDPMIRTHTLRILYEEPPDISILSAISNALSDSNAHVVRTAVELLSRYPSMETLQSLIALQKKIPCDDNHLLYTVKLNLRVLLKNDTLLNKVAFNNLDQTDAAILTDVLTGIPSETAGTFMFNYISRYGVPNTSALRVFRHMAEFVPVSKLRNAIELAIKNTANSSDSAALLLFEGVQHGLQRRAIIENTELRKWGTALATRVLKKYPYSFSAPPPVLQLQTFAADAAGKYMVKELTGSLTAFVENASSAEFTRGSDELYDSVMNLKQTAMRSLIRIDPEKSPAIVLKILNDTGVDIHFRNAVGSVLGEFPGNVVNDVLDKVKNASPDLQASMAIALSNSVNGIDVLFEQVANGNISSRVLLLPKILERLNINGNKNQQKKYQLAVAGLKPVDQEKQEIIYNRLFAYSNLKAKPNTDSGMMVYTRNCAPCHSIAGKGGSIGPNLDGVNQWGVKALAEKILDPDRNVSENFRMYILKLKDGKIVSGLYRRNEGAAKVFADNSGKEFSVQKNEIVEERSSRYTLMPDDFKDKLTENDFNLLINYLLNHSKNKTQ